MTDLTAQFICLGKMLGFGCFAAWLWEADEVLRGYWKKKLILIGCLDFFSCCLVTLLFWQLLVISNNGIFRNYAVLGGFLGVILYRKFLHRWGELFWKKLGRICLGFARLAGKLYQPLKKSSQDIAEEDMNSI